MAIRDVTGVAVYASANGGAGTYVLVSDLTAYDATHGSEGETRTRVFGQALPYVRVGEDTDEYSLDGLHNPEDAGQDLIRAAKDGGTTVFVAFLDDEDAETGYTQECNCTEYGDGGESDGEYMEGVFSLTGAGVRTPITALP